MQKQSSSHLVHFLTLEIQHIVNSLTGDVQIHPLIRFQLLILSLIQLAMVQASH